MKSSCILLKEWRALEKVVCIFIFSLTETLPVSEIVLTLWGTYHICSKYMEDIYGTYHICSKNCRARAGATGFWRNFLKRFQEALVQTQVRFNGVRRRLQSRSRRRFWESLVQAQVRTGFPARGFTRTLQKDL